MRLKSIDITNFRGFDHLKVEDFGQLNVIVGRNNSGKTSLLEALLFIFDCNHPYFLVGVNRMRRIQSERMEDFVTYFHGLSAKNIIDIKGNFTDKEDRGFVRQVSLKAASQSNFTDFAPPNPFTYIDQTGTIKPDTSPLQIVLESKMENGDKGLFRVRMGENGRPTIEGSNDQRLGEQGNQNYSTVYLSPISSDFIFLEPISTLIKQKAEGKIVALLKEVDDRINGINIIGDRVYFDYEGADELIPSTIIGDGVRRVLSVVAYLANSTQNTVVFIEEIENGLYYKTHKQLWKAIIAAIRQSGVQIFVTTHSVETLKSLKEILDEEVDFQSEVRVFDLAKTKLKGYKAYKYTYEGLAGAIENDTEIRL